MAQLDHLNVAWAHAFFPWAFLSLLVYMEKERVFWLLLSSLLMGINLFLGHPQVFFMECLFFLFWALFSNVIRFKKRMTATAGMGLGGPGSSPHRSSFLRGNASGAISRPIGRHYKAMMYLSGAGPAW